MLSRTRSQRASDFPLAWERLLWSGRPAGLAGLIRVRDEYHVTDFRAVVRRGDRTIAELTVHDLKHVDLRQSRAQRLRGTSTVVLRPKGRGETITFANIRQGPQLAFILELLASGRIGFEIDRALISEALGPDSARLFGPQRGMLIASAVTAVLIIGLSAAAVVRVHAPSPIVYPSDDAIYPGGQKRSRAEIVKFMEAEVMPFARRTLGSIKGGADKITCFTCHGRDAEARDWQMPSVRALPEPDLRGVGMERYASLVDAQMRNAVYGYLAEDHKQRRAAYMRGVVMPGMARVLHRPPYDFTQTYSYNRARFAFGCYHCHMVSASALPVNPAAPAFMSTPSP